MKGYNPHGSIAEWNRILCSPFLGINSIVLPRITHDTIFPELHSTSILTQNSFVAAYQTAITILVYNYIQVTHSRHPNYKNNQYTDILIKINPHVTFNNFLKQK